MRTAQLSAVATLLLRALVERTGLGRDRILVGRFHSVDWQSLTFIGERHEIGLRLAGPDAATALAALRDGLVDAEWELGGHFVADIVIVADKSLADGSVAVDLEALTIRA